jgi:hypothetical protein
VCVCVCVCVCGWGVLWSGTRCHVLGNDTTVICENRVRRSAAYRNPIFAGVIVSQDGGGSWELPGLVPDVGVPLMGGAVITVPAPVQPPTPY